jgi:hypothetical protein
MDRRLTMAEVANTIIEQLGSAKPTEKTNEKPTETA